MTHNTTKEQKRNLKKSNLPDAIKRARKDVAEWKESLVRCQAGIPRAEAGIEEAQARLDDLEKRAIREQFGE